MQIIAHRGSSLLAPENTLAAAKLAWQEGADALEGDFRLTADGQIVCLHDATLKRTAGIDRQVSQCTLTELQQYDVGNWKSQQYAGERVPTLNQLLATVPAGKQVYVEIKCGTEIIEPLARTIAACGLAASQIIPISLDLAVITAIKLAIPQCPAYWVVEFKRTSSGQWQPTADEILQSAVKANLDGLDLMATGPINAEFVQRIRAAKIGLCVWTVDDPALARRLLDFGITGITTNRPGWLRKELCG
ncbi:MAG TPA: glycerophosphodiester phosphodiesterase [Pirellulales bacterium]|jgi:glycerophosphoryl diester phosphodiesterase